MIKQTFFLSLFTIIFFACAKNTSKTVVPADAMLFDYDEKNQRAILLKGVINDTIPMNFFFDTGAGIEIYISDSIQCQLEADSCFLKIGNNIYYKKLSYLSHDNFLFEYFGQNTAMIGFQFFENKIMKISYKNKYVSELSDTFDLDNFKCIPLKTVDNLLHILVEIYIQETRIAENVILDTGCNGLVDLHKSAEYYSISTDGAQQATAFSMYGPYQKYFIPADSVKVGYAIISDHPVAFSARGNLLGNAFFEHFDVVLDLINFNLYLKPNE